MDINLLKQNIKSRKAKIGVIGLGYVGLPAALAFAESGFKVIGFDINREKVEVLMSGKLPFGENEPGLEELLQKSKHSFEATQKMEELRQCDIYIIAVATPLNIETKKVDIKPLKNALKAVAQLKPQNSLVIIESTIAPKTSENFAIPLIEKNSGLMVNKDFFLLHCPERITPGLTIHNLRQMPRVIGASNPEAGELGRQLYSAICQNEIIVSSLKIAEVVKTAENAERDVQIAFANELAIICDEYGADFYKVRELINKVPGKNILSPGAGVGGHCIPKDPWLLVSNLKNLSQVQLIPVARRINDSMPSYVLKLLRQMALKNGDKLLKEKKIAILGYAYREDTDDMRMSPSETLANLLRAQDAVVGIHDPFVRPFSKDIEMVLADSYAVVVMVGHSYYKKLDLCKIKARMSGNIMIDCRHVFRKTQAEKAGLIYKGIGE